MSCQYVANQRETWLQLPIDRDEDKENHRILGALQHLRQSIEKVFGEQLE